MDAADYRAGAAELREMAQTVHDPTAHKELLSLAERYELLATHADAAEKRSKR